MTDFDRILHDINAAGDARTLWRIMLDWFHDQGIRMVGYHALEPGKHRPTFVADGYPEEWVRTYVGQNLLEIDPIPEIASRMARPFYWHEVRELMSHTPEHLRYVEHMEKAHLGDGLAFYVFGPGLRNAYIGLGFGVERVELDPDEVFRLQCVAQAAHLRFCALHDDQFAALDLSHREREILQWISKGKSNSVIASLLKISPHTVDAHLRSIYRKLGVSDRTTAAIRGVGSGVIQYPVF